MKRNYLINLGYLLLILIIFTAFKTLGYSSAAVLRQDTIFYIMYIPVSTIFVLFGLWDVAFSTPWKSGLKNIYLSIYSIVITILLYVFSILLPSFYYTFGNGAQWLTLTLILLFIIASIPLVHIKKLTYVINKFSSKIQNQN